MLKTTWRCPCAEELRPHVYSQYQLSSGFAAEVSEIMEQRKDVCIVSCLKFWSTHKKCVALYYQALGNSVWPQ